MSHNTVKKPVTEVHARAISNPYLTAARESVQTARSGFLSNRSTLLKTNLNVNQHKEFMNSRMAAHTQLALKPQMRGKTSHGEKLPEFGNFRRMKNQETYSFAPADEKITHRNAATILDPISLTTQKDKNPKIYESLHKRKPLDFITHSDFSVYRT
jgi:hypothetical protein